MHSLANPHSHLPTHTMLTCTPTTMEPNRKGGNTPIIISTHVRHKFITTPPD